MLQPLSDVIGAQVLHLSMLHVPTADVIEFCRGRFGKTRCTGDTESNHYTGAASGVFTSVCSTGTHHAYRACCHPRTILPGPAVTDTGV